MDVKELQRIIEEVVTSLMNTKHKRLFIVHPHTTISKKQLEILRNYFQIEEWQMNETTSSSQLFYDAIVFLEVDQAFIVSSAQGLPNSPTSLYLSELLINNKTAILVPDEKLSAIISTKEPNAYMEMLLQHIERLKEFGCSIQLFAQLIRVLKQQEETSRSDIVANYLTADMLQSYKGQQLKLHAHTKLTPLAQEVIQEKGITIQRH
ncbi:hypothetical protein [Lysinibacillus sp. Y5S-8]|uniref:hypothetical protein n=1 Tax=Lysinibacillus sp. Y5S-8 TaxID=3122488 RepID=UPI0030D4ACB7